MTSKSDSPTNGDLQCGRQLILFCLMAETDPSAVCCALDFCTVLLAVIANSSYFLCHHHSLTFAGQVLAYIPALYTLHWLTSILRCLWICSFPPELSCTSWCLLEEVMVDWPLFQQQGMSTRSFSASKISSQTAKAMQDVLLHKDMT